MSRPFANWRLRRRARYLGGVRAAVTALRDAPFRVGFGLFFLAAEFAVYLEIAGGRRVAGFA